MAAWAAIGGGATLMLMVLASQLPAPARPVLEGAGDPSAEAPSAPPVAPAHHTVIGTAVLGESVVAGPLATPFLSMAPRSLTLAPATGSAMLDGGLGMLAVSPPPRLSLGLTLGAPSPSAAGPVAARRAPVRAVGPVAAVPSHSSQGPAASGSRAPAPLTPITTPVDPTATGSGSARKRVGHSSTHGAAKASRANNSTTVANAAPGYAD